MDLSHKINLKNLSNLDHHSSILLMDLIILNSAMAHICSELPFLYQLSINNLNSISTLCREENMALSQMDPLHLSPNYYATITYIYSILSLHTLPPLFS